MQEQELLVPILQQERQDLALGQEVQDLEVEPVFQNQALEQEVQDLMAVFLCLELEEEQP